MPGAAGGSPGRGSPERRIRTQAADPANPNSPRGAAAGRGLLRREIGRYGAPLSRRSWGADAHSRTPNPRPSIITRSRTRNGREACSLWRTRLILQRALASRGNAGGPRPHRRARRGGAGAQNGTAGDVSILRHALIPADMPRAVSPSGHLHRCPLSRPQGIAGMLGRHTPGTPVPTLRTPPSRSSAPMPQPIGSGIAKHPRRRSRGLIFLPFKAAAISIWARCSSTEEDASPWGHS